MRFAYGGAEVGAHLCEHDDVDSVHITGSARTHDMIVFGSDETLPTANAGADPVLSKPITSELGGVGATIVVPGPWDDGDIAYQAEHLATMKLHNGGFNCIALQVIVLPESWDRTVELEDALAQTDPVTRTPGAVLPGCRRAAGRPGGRASRRGAARRLLGAQDAHPRCRSR